MVNIVYIFQDQGRQTGGGVGGLNPPEFWRGGLNPPDFEEKNILIAHPGPFLVA